MTVRDGARSTVQVGISIFAALMLYFGPMGPLLLSMVHFNSPFIQRILRDIDGEDAGDGLGGDGDDRFSDLPKFDLPEMNEAVAALTPPEGEDVVPSDTPPTDAPADAPADEPAVAVSEVGDTQTDKPKKAEAVADKTTKPGKGDKTTWRNRGTPDPNDDVGGGSRGGKGKAAPCEADDPRVRTVGGVVEIDRAAVEYYSSHLAEFNALGDAGTHRNPNGKVDGFKIGLGRCGLLYEAGFRNGDIVHAVNGTPIYTVVEAVRAYVKLRTQSRFEVRVTRRGRLELLKFRVV